LMKREIPLITDRRIDMNFGTGAVKITPAHDMLDWQIGKDNNLEEIQVINEQAKITELGGRFKGQSTLEARANILSDLKKLDLFEKEETVKNSISLCERCKAVIEPLVSLQWFINVDAEKFSLKKEAIKSIKAGKINFYPENFKKIMLQWFNGLNDWCISRQIWWGHQFPVWYCQCSSEEPIVSLERPKACPKCGSQKIIQDENTFDTWFSSGQWAYTSLGFPNGSDYKNFYPSQMMVMGRDILFFWAARMVMMSLYRTKNVPFKNIYFTGLIRDREGNKMSKSRDNGIDPLQMIEKFGADALRLSLVMDISAGQDSRLYEEKIENYRNFVTKLWNIARYAKTSVPDFCLIKKLKKNSIKTVSNRWIITNLNQTIEEVTKFMEEKNISLAQERLRNFTWDDFADWYIEINKMEKNPEVIGFVLDKIIRLWHPFAPFVTEKIWQEIEAKNKMLMISEWPQKTACVFPTKEKKYFQDLKNLVTKIRNIKANYRIKPADRIVAYAENFAEKSIIEKLAKIRILKYPKNEAKLVRVEFGDKKIFLDILSKVDLKKELINMERELDVLKTAIEKHKNLLKNPGFLKKAAQEQIVSARERLLGYQTNLKEKNEIMGNFKKLV